MRICDWCFEPGCTGKCDLAIDIKKYHDQVGRFNNEFARVVSLREMVQIRSTLDGPLVATSGYFAPLHFGHQGMLAHSKHFGKYLLAIVSGDEPLRRKKGAAFMPLAQRAAIISAVRGPDFVLPFEQPIPGDDGVTLVLDLVKPNVFTKGGDRVDGNFEEREFCERNGIDIRYPPAFSGAGPHSTEFLTAWSDHANYCRDVRELIAREVRCENDDGHLDR